MRVKIDAKGWAGFTGQLGGIQFKDGVSVDELSVRDQRRLSAITSISNAEDGSGVGVNAAQPVTKNQPIPMASKLIQKTKPETEFPEQINEPDYEVDTSKKAKMPSPKDLLEKPDADADDDDGIELVEPGDEIPVNKPKNWDLQSLQKLADTQGIAGIREVAEPLGIKGRSISELIDGILHRLANPKADK